MRQIFAIGDLHMSGTQDKAMDVFGPSWRNHVDRIAKNWRSKVGTDDIVLVPGDISWAMHLEDAAADLQVLHALPGQKILVRGNHDYWWASPAKVRQVLPDSIRIIQNDAVKIENTVFCGTRGWAFPAGQPFSDHDRKIFEREKLRLRMTLDRARHLDGAQTFVMLHYPPLYDGYADTDFVEILDEFRPDHVVFGHLHGRILDQVNLRGTEHHGIIYDLVSADYVNFDPVEVGTTGG